MLDAWFYNHALVLLLGDRKFMNNYPKYLQDIISEFSKLPGIGHKTAVRLSMHVINKNLEDVMCFSEAIKNCKLNLKYCEKCSNLSDDKFCYVCSNKSRDNSIICVVQDIRDVYAFEKVGNYQGVYHVLHGLISPNKGIGPENLNINNLVQRIDCDEVVEVILSTGLTLEGEATSAYISKLLYGKKVKVTRLAYGIPLGSDLDYVDEMTLGRALDFRQKYE